MSYLTEEIVFDQPLKENRKIATGQKDYLTIVCLLDYPYFKENFRLIATGSNKK